MRSILDTVRVSRSSLAKLRDSDSYQRVVSDLKDAERRLRTARSFFIGRSVVALEMNVITSNELSKRLNSDLEAISAMVSQVMIKSDLESLRVLKEAINEFVDGPLKAVNGEIDDKIRHRWLTDKQDVSPQRCAILAAFSRIPGLSGAPEVLLGRADNIYRITSPSVDDVAELRTLLSDIRNFLVDQAGGAQEVVDFVEASASTQGATIEQFTDPVVQKWLLARGLLNSVRVKI